jgi:hypothetical protein
MQISLSTESEKFIREQKLSELRKKIAAGTEQIRQADTVDGNWYFSICKSSWSA